MPHPWPRFDRLRRIVITGTMSDQLVVVDTSTLRTLIREELERLLERQPEKAVSLQEAAEVLGVSSRTVQRMVARGEIPSIKFGRTVRIPLHKIMR